MFSLGATPGTPHDSNGIPHMESRKWNPAIALRRMESRKWKPANGIPQMESCKWTGLKTGGSPQPAPSPPTPCTSNDATLQAPLQSVVHDLFGNPPLHLVQSM